MDNHFLQGNCLPLEFSSLPWGGDCSPNQEGAGEGGGKLALGQSGTTGGGLLSLRPSRQLPQSPLLSHLPAQRHSLPRGQLQKRSSGDTFLAWSSSELLVVGLMFSWEPHVSPWRRPVFRLLQSQEQRRLPVLVLLLIRSKTLGRSLALLGFQSSHW